MKSLKYLIESILGDLDKDLDNEAFLHELQAHEMTTREPGWGHNYTRYEIKGNILSILSSKSIPWNCNSNKFWELIKTMKIKFIESNSDLVFRDIDFDINGISINTSGSLSIRNCKADIKNCNLNCAKFGIYDNRITLNKVNIKTDAVVFKRCILDQKNISINCKSVNIEYDKLKGSDWGNYIESLGVIKILPSGRIKILNEMVELNEDFIPFISSNATKYYIYTGVKFSAIKFEKCDAPDYLARFKNGWICKFIK